MSIELILAIFFFGVLPLIERAIRGKREQQGPPTQEPPPYRSPGDARASGQRASREDEAWETESYEEAPYEELPDDEAPYEVPPPYVPPPVVAVPKAVRQRASEVPISRVTAHDRRTADAFDRPSKRRRARGGRVADILHTEAGLKHAFVMMTVLGPCRAFSPYGDQ